MAIPLWTTTITILRASNAATADRLTAKTWATVATGIHAVIGMPSGQEIQTGATQADIRLSLVCDPCDLRHTDRVRDDTTNQTYEAEIAVSRPGLGLDHVEGRLRQITGVQQ